MFSMNPFRAIVTAEKMILIVPVEAESLLSVVYDHMKGTSQSYRNSHIVTVMKEISLTLRVSHDNQ